jgi:hypothetical protein
MQWDQFQHASAMILHRLPRLKDRICRHPDKVITHYPIWEGLLKVCLYFIDNPRPQQYIRELSLRVDTKFIENNQPIVRSLLDFLLEEKDIRDKEEKDIEKRYYLQYDEPRVRLRFLDPALAVHHPDDISYRISELHHWNYPCDIVLLAENKKNMLTIPPIPSALVLRTVGGFHISYLKDINCLKDKRIYYWGDLDIQGFEILHQMRGYYPQTRSVMMDKATLRKFNSKPDTGEKSSKTNISLLEIPEKALHKLLKKKNWQRLEQEKIPRIM